MRRLRFCLAVLLVAPACSGPRLPGSVTWEGRTLEKATDWSQGGIAAVVFVPRGEKLDTATLQVGILASQRHTSGRALHLWSLEQYHRSPTNRLHEVENGDESCKVGAVAAGTGVRAFLAFHVCRDNGKQAACAEADERLANSLPCAPGDFACWQDMCDTRWEKRRRQLEPLAKAALGG